LLALRATVARIERAIAFDAALDLERQVLERFPFGKQALGRSLELGPLALQLDQALRGRRRSLRGLMQLRPLHVESRQRAEHSLPRVQLITADVGRSHLRGGQQHLFRLRPVDRPFAVQRLQHDVG
jgi:hypothetical protein